MPIVACHGFASLSLLYEAVQRWVNEERQVNVYYLGDHDPSGVLIDQSMAEKLEEMDPSHSVSDLRTVGSHARPDHGHDPSHTPDQASRQPARSQLRR